MRQRGPGQPCAMSLHLVRYISLYVYLYFVKPCVFLCEFVFVIEHYEIYALVHVSALYLKFIKNLRV